MKQPRSTADIVVIILASMVCAVVLIIVAGIVIIKLFYPATEHELATEAIINIVTTALGALVGFIGGRSYEKQLHNNHT